MFQDGGSSGRALCWHHSNLYIDVLENVDDMLVAGEHHYLMSKFSEGLQCSCCTDCSISVKIDQYVIQDKWQHHTAA